MHFFSQEHLNQSPGFQSVFLRTPEVMLVSSGIVSGIFLLIEPYGITLETQH